MGRKVFIGFDCRRQSKEFAQEAAQVLAAHHIRSFLYEELRPLANISFGIRHFQCVAGIMITASHNPPQYNGYKVFWSTGGQVLPPHDRGIMEEMKRITGPSMVLSSPPSHPLIGKVGEEIDQAYLHSIAPHQLHRSENHDHGPQLKVVYTSLHGAGITMIPKTLQKWGFTNVTCVEEQSEINGDFPTILSPNPEERAALTLGIKKLETCQGDLLLGTDPDTDRLGVVVMHNGAPFFFDGQQVACLLLEHLCRSLQERGVLHTQPQRACIKTIVTTELFTAIAKHYDVECFDVLTGFKYVGEKIDEWEERKAQGIPSYAFLLGAERELRISHRDSRKR